MRLLIIILSLCLMFPAIVTANNEYNLKQVILPQNCLFDVIDVGVEQLFYFYTPESCGINSTNAAVVARNNPLFSGNNSNTQADDADAIEELFKETSQDMQKTIPFNQAATTSEKPITENGVIVKLLLALGIPVVTVSVATSLVIAIRKKRLGV